MVVLVDVKCIYEGCDCVVGGGMRGKAGVGILKKIRRTCHVLTKLTLIVRTNLFLENN